MRRVLTAWALCASVLAASGLHEPTAQIVSVTDAPSLGSTLAKIVIVEYSDFHCPFCRRHARDVLPRLKRDYVDAGHARYVYRSFPLAGPAAVDVAVGAMCAARQGKFWEIHDRFFGGPRPVAPRDVESHARSLKLDLGPFRTCLKGIAREDVRMETAEARRLGFRGTPGFAIGLREDDDRMRIVHRMGGAQSYDLFKKVLDELIARD